MDTNTKPKESFKAVIIVVLIIALGGAYFWYMRATTKAQTPKPTQEQVLNQDLGQIDKLSVDADLSAIDDIYKK